MTKPRKNIYFASDFHLGVDTRASSKERELVICQWLLEIKDSAKAIYLLGDIFDYWFEYKSSIPKGFSHFLSALRTLRNEGVEIFILTGNHDMWMYSYFTDEYEITVHHNPQTLILDGKTFLIGHGDGLGPGDNSYKIIKKIFRNSIIQRCFSLLHPSFALRIMRNISQRDAYKYAKDQQFIPKNELLIQYAENYEEKIDYFIFGHRHIAYDYTLSNGNRIVNLGDWISYNSYAIWDGNNLKLKQYGYFTKDSVTG